MDRQQLGPLGERACAQVLRKKGYRILDVNYRTRFGEIDIIAEKKPYIIFVEVKTRSPRESLPPWRR